MGSGNGFPIYRSIRTRFAAIISMIAAIAIAIVAYIFGTQFNDSLTTSIRDELVKDAESSAAAVGDRVQIRADRFTSFLNPHVQKSSEELLGHINRFLENDSDYLTLSVYTFNGETGTIEREINSKLSSAQEKSPLFFGKNSKLVHSEVLAADRRIARQILAGKFPNYQDGDFQFVSTAQTVGAPIFSIYAKLRTAAGKGTKGYLVSATIWMTALMGSLPKASGSETVLVDDSGTVVGSAILGDVSKGKSLQPFEITRYSSTEKSGSGFFNRNQPHHFAEFLPDSLSEFLPDSTVYTYPYKDRLEWVGAYARVQRRDLGMLKHTVIVQKKAEYVFGVLERSLRDTFLVALFVVFGAAAVGALWATESTAQLKNVYTATAQIAAGNFSVQIPVGVSDEIGQIAKSVNFMAEELKSQVDLKAEKGRLQAEADTAKTVQETFFPTGAIDSGNLTISGAYQPATECGGDLWGHFSIRPGVDLIYIADAMGHGASAAIMTAMAYTSCNLITEFLKANHEKEESPGELLEQMNAVIHGAVKGKISVTCFVVVYDFNRGEMVYANAGHNFPFVCFRKNGSDEATAQALIASGNPLGVAGESVFPEKRRPIIPGERIVMFTDGLIECRNTSGEMWGRKALSAAVRSAGKLDSIEEIRNSIGGMAFSFFGDRPIDDDVTLVVAEVKSSWSGASDSNHNGSESQSNSEIEIDLRVG